MKVNRTRWGDEAIDSNDPLQGEEGSGLSFVLLTMDSKTICRTKVCDVPDAIKIPSTWSIIKFVPTREYRQSDLLKFSLLPDPEDDHQTTEWERFMRYLCSNGKDGIVKFRSGTFYILAPKPRSFSHVVILYETGLKESGVYKSMAGMSDPTETRRFVITKPHPNLAVAKRTSTPSRNFVSTDPNYIRTLSQTHAGWIFAAIAELIDNSRDARASMLDISIQYMFSEQAQESFPVLCVVDNGHGMTYNEMMRMVSFGHKRPDEHSKNQIGTFGIGFKVPLDYSLKAYLEVMFLNPQMNISVQGSPVTICHLERTLCNTSVLSGEIMGRTIQVTLGRSDEEWGRMNCGIFLYWHGRLIESYKRVGGQKHNADTGRGIIGVADITDLIDDEDGNTWVLNSKQGFQDCEIYAKLEEWLGRKIDEYWDAHFYHLNLRKIAKSLDCVDEWVQCYSCCKWRMLNACFSTESLPTEWFCHLPPFNGRCEIPEQQMEVGVITVAENRSGHNKAAQPEVGSSRLDEDVKNVRLMPKTVDKGKRSSDATSSDDSSQAVWYRSPTFEDAVEVQEQL